jgi:hypothetical protein
MDENGLSEQEMANIKELAADDARKVAWTMALEGQDVPAEVIGELEERALANRIRQRASGAE